MRIRLWAKLPGPFVLDGGSKPKRDRQKIDGSTPSGLAVKAGFWIAAWILATIFAPVPMLILTAFIGVFVVIPARIGIKYVNRKYGTNEVAEEEARKLERDNA